MPIHYAQQTIHISKIQDNVVTLDSPLFFKASVLTLFQVHVVLDDANRAQQCWDFWNTYWKRDQHEDNEQILQDAQVIVQALPTWEEFPGTQIQAYDFRKALLGTKKRSMRGSCKFSVCELLALPAEYLELLCTILRQIELGQPWPKQWCQAFVVLLPKPDADSTSPSGLRPITILSRVYRTWARTHTLQILRWASRFAAPLIGGGVRGIDPTVLMMHVSFLIEQATKEEPLHGLVVDIRKCFNSIHRGLILAALREFGIPEYMINPCSNLMKNFERVFVFDGFVSDCQTSHTGVPEGCPLAVVAMLFVTLSMYHYMHSTCPDTIVYAFADNWSLLNGSTGPLKQAISCFEHFCDLFKLPLAGDKSWLRSTEQSGRKELVGIVLQGQPVPIKHQEREPGFDMTYTKKGFEKSL